MEINLKDWNTYTEAEKQIMMHIIDIRHKLDIVDIMIMKNIKDVDLLEKHFTNKINKQDEIIHTKEFVKGSLG